MGAEGGKKSLKGGSYRGVEVGESRIVKGTETSALGTPTRKIHYKKKPPGPGVSIVPGGQLASDGFSTGPTNPRSGGSRGKRKSLNSEGKKKRSKTRQIGWLKN